MKISNLVYTLLAAVVIVIILIYGKNVIMPFVLAIMIWFLLKVVRNGIKKVKFKKRSLPIWLQSLVAFVLIFGILTLVGKLLASNVAKISDPQLLKGYENTIDQMVLQLNEKFNTDIYGWFKEYSGNMEFSSLIKSIINSISDLLGSAFMVIIYVLFLLLEEAVFSKKLRAIFPEKERFEKTHGILTKLNKSINSYISLKTLVSIITGLLSYFVLLLIGVDFAFFWAFLIFTLNYIPTIGSLIATLFPSIIALLQYGSFSYFILVLGLIGAVQLLVGNFLEPRIMGNSLNISPLVVIIALTFWGAIWGVLGMILSVPITVMMIIVFAQFPSTRKIAILLSAKGDV